MAKQINAKFIVSASNINNCPDTNLPEFPLLGRSNVGKSSFINCLCNNSKLAKTSNTPGKTRLINFFNFTDKFIIADLPGYGYAKVSKEAQNEWAKNLEEYLIKRKQIASLIQLVDGRHDVQKNDIQMREWVKVYNLPVITVVTKIDYVKKSKFNETLKKVEDVFNDIALPFSAVDRQYCDKIFETIEEIILKKEN